MINKISDKHSKVNIANKHATKTINKYVYCVEKGSLKKSKLLKKISHDLVIVEQPLQIRLLWHDNAKQCSQVFSITMRTPDNDELLILGLLYSEGVISAYADIDKISQEIASNTPESSNTNVIDNLWQVKLAAGVIPKLASLERFQITYSSCGLCGSTSLKSLELKNPPNLKRIDNDFEESSAWLKVNDVLLLPQIMREKQQMFKQTGGVHGAALFVFNDNKISKNEVKFFTIGEDIGRHNALDKVIGTLIKTTKIATTEHTTSEISAQVKYTVVVSGRISFEIVQKTIMAGISVLIGVGAPSDLAIKAAQRFDLTLIGFAGSESFNVYHGDWRLK